MPSVFNLDTTVAFNKRKSSIRPFSQPLKKSNLTAVFPQVCYMAWRCAKATAFTAVLPSELVSLRRSEAVQQSMLPVVACVTFPWCTHMWMSEEGGFDRWAGLARLLPVVNQEVSPSGGESRGGVRWLCGGDTVSPFRGVPLS